MKGVQLYFNPRLGQFAWDPVDLSYSISWRYKEPPSSTYTVDGKVLACPASSSETPLQLTDGAYEQGLLELFGALVHQSAVVAFPKLDMTTCFQFRRKQDNGNMVQSTEIQIRDPLFEFGKHAPLGGS